MQQLALIGSGGHARECIDAARAAGDRVICLLDDDTAKWGQSIMGVPVAAGGLNAVRSLPQDARLIIAVGDNQARARIAEALSGHTFGTLVHPFSWVAQTATIMSGAMIFAGTVVQTAAHIGHHVILNTGATVSHDCVIGDCAHVAVGAHLAGNVSVGSGAMIGAGVTARPGARIGDRAVIGAGSVVVQDIADDTTAFGAANATPK